MDPQIETWTSEAVRGLSFAFALGVFIILAFRGPWHAGLTAAVLVWGAVAAFVFLSTRGSRR